MIAQKIALIGASGKIGSRIQDEAIARGHLVTGTTRHAANLSARDRLTVAEVSPAEPDALAAVVKSHDAAIVALRWDSTDINTVIDAVRRSGVKRALFVVGAGSLRRSDGRLHFAHMANPPSSSKPAMLALDALRNVDDLNWTAISPPATIEPGQRTGRFRTDTDTMVVDAQDQGHISREDFAVAILDEIERPQHLKERFTVGYA
jgi:uncharacterized protein